MGNASTRGNLVEPCSSSYDETTINRGTVGRPRPLLKFHSVHGENVQLLDEGRIARRKESFCKALAFSNRPIAVDEIVCLSLCEVGTSWSGVLRFGVTNVDPASFRDIELPKFVCPDLTSKHGYWAKALAERYSTDKAILHFFVNADGELHYGVNGVSKGLFLAGINVDAPLWIVVDIYGNSVGVEFMDLCAVELRSLNKLLRSKQTSPSGRDSRRPSSMSLIGPVPATSLEDELTPVGLTSTMTASTSAANLTTTAEEHGRMNSTRNSPFNTPLHFHSVKGANISLVCNDLVAVRRHGEYNLGYVFTNRPIRADEVISVVVLQSEDVFTGSLTFGLTSCDPVNVADSRLPVDSDDLLERGEYWVCIKDVGVQPQTGDRLTFRVDAKGKVHFAKNNATPKVIMHVDMTVKLWAFFDLYGTTAQIVMDNAFLQQSNGVTSPTTSVRSHRASSEGAFSAGLAAPMTIVAIGENASTSALPTLASSAELGGATNERSNGQLDNPAFWDRLLVALPPPTSSAAETTRGNISHVGSNSEGNLRATQTKPRVIALPGVSSTEAGASSMSSSASSSGHEVDGSFSTRVRTNPPSHRLNSYLNRTRPMTTTPLVTSTALAEMTTTTTNLSVATPPLSKTKITAGFSLLGDDFDLIANRYSSMLSSRRRGQGPSYSASPDPSSIRNATVTSRSPSTSVYATPSVTPNTYGSVLREALQCLNDAVTSSYHSNPSSSTSLSITNGPSTVSSELNHTGGTPSTRPTAPSASDTVKCDEDTVKDLVDGSECSICMNNRINAVIYRCGHMCMCFPCAKELNRRSGDCPICRMPIIDVIRCYPA